MAKSARVKQEAMDTTSNEEPGDQVLDLRKANPGNQLCIWCMKKKVCIDAALGQDFCSEVCFEQFRRDSFKKRSSCFWCANHNSNGLMSKALTSNLDETKFCSEYCLAQFKVRLFCEETSSHLEQLKDIPINGLGPNSGSSFPPPIVGATGNKDLITPDLWLTKPNSGFHSVADSKKHSGFGPVSAFPTTTPSVLDQLFVTSNDRITSSSSIVSRHVSGLDQLSPSSLSVTSSRRPSSPSSGSIHSLSPMASPAAGGPPSKKRGKPSSRGSASTRGSGSATNSRANYRNEPNSNSRGRKVPTSLLSLAGSSSSSNSNGLPPRNPNLTKTSNTTGTTSKRLPPTTMYSSTAQDKEFRDSVLAYNRRFTQQPPPPSSVPIPYGRTPNGQQLQSDYEKTYLNFPKNIPPVQNYISKRPESRNTAEAAAATMRAGMTAMNTQKQQSFGNLTTTMTAQRLEAMLPKILVLIPYPIPFPIPFPVSLNDLQKGNSNNGNNKGKGGEEVKRTLHQLDEMD